MIRFLLHRKGWLCFWLGMGFLTGSRAQEPVQTVPDLPALDVFWKGQEQPKGEQGMFVTYRLGDKIYWEVPDSLLGRDMMLTHTVLQAPARRKRDMDKKFGFAGDLFGPIMLRFQKQAGELWVVEPYFDRVFDGKGGTVTDIARLRGDEGLYETLPICAVGPHSSLVEVSSWLKSSPLFSLSSVSFDLAIGGEIYSKRKVESVEGRPDRMLIRRKSGFKTSTLFRPGAPQMPSHETEWETGSCLSLLPPPLEPLPGSASYFSIHQRLFGEQEGRRFLSKRWRLELTPEDSVRYQKGERVKPVRPIVFYIDKHTPERWRKVVKEAVEAWQPVFEKAGFREAISARMEPTAEEDPLFSVFDSQYPYISWKTSGMNNAYGPTPCEARSAEIMACHVGIFSSVLDILQRWYFVQCGAVDPDGCLTKYPDSLMGELIKLVVTHEVGHTLGLEHNHFGSSAYAIEQLRDNDFLTRHGMGTSIMDYMRCNYALRPGDRTDLRNRIARIGVYDYWAIEWGYRIFPGKTVEERNRQRAEWMRKEWEDPEKWFVNQGDVRAQAEDLGNDAMAFNAQGMENLRYLSEQERLWTPANAMERRVMQRRYTEMISMAEIWMQHVMYHLGGRFRPDPFSGSADFRFETAANNRRALDFMLTYFFEPPVWLFAAERAKALQLDSEEWFDSFCNRNLRMLMERWEQVDYVQAGDAEAYGLEEMAEAIRGTLFKEWSAGADVEPLKFVLQKAYIRQLRKQVDKGSRVSSHLLAVAWRELKEIRLAALKYACKAQPGRAKGQVEELLQVYLNEI